MANTVGCYPGVVSVAIGDFNLREGEDQCMKDESWKDLWDVTRATTTQVRQEYTWERGENRFRLDRVYLHTPNDNMHV